VLVLVFIGAWIAAGPASLSTIGSAAAQPSSTVLYVDNTNPGATDTNNNCQAETTPCATISNAVAQAQGLSAATIDVQAGAYDEAISITLPSFGSTLTIVGGPAPVSVTAPPGSSVFTINFGFGRLTLSNLLITGGVADPTTGGGAVDNNGIAFFLNDSFSDDSAPGSSGGAVQTDGGSTMVGDTFVNDSANFGGAVENFGGATIVDDTFANDSATYQGGAILTGTSAELVNDTFSHNSAASGGGVYNEFDATLANTIFADGSSAGANCVDNPLNGGSGVTDDGYNVADNADCGMSAANNDEVNVADTGTGGINLGAPQDNGGATQTQAITTDSAAYHEVPLANCAPPDKLAQVDQRQVPRPQPPASVQGPQTFCDAGAFEYAPPVVSGISPGSGESGTEVTLTGYGFTLANAVDFGTTPADGVDVVSDTQITAAAPPGSGTVDVTVTNPDGVSPQTDADRFTYLLPTSLLARRAVLTPGHGLSVLAGLSATLTSSGAPVARQTVVFASPSGIVICSGSTNPAGRAGCPSERVPPALVSDGYVASYAGSPIYAPTSTGGPVFVVPG
jgi:predicted outer membrane repeat protein